MGRVRKNCVLISNILTYSTSFIYLWIGFVTCSLQKDIRSIPVIKIHFIDIMREADKPQEQSKVTQLANGREKKNRFPELGHTQWALSPAGSLFNLAMH